MQFGHKTFLQGIKGKLCKHTLGLVYDRKKDFPVDPRITAVRFIRKRKAGRPRNLRPALTREPPLVVVDGQFQQPERPGNRGEAVPEAAEDRGNQLMLQSLRGLETGAKLCLVRVAAGEEGEDRGDQLMLQSQPTSGRPCPSLEWLTEGHSCSDAHVWAPVRGRRILSRRRMRRR